MNSSESSNGGVILKPPVKQISPAIRWSFTLNNYDNEIIDELVPKFQNYCKFAIVGKEGAETETPHLQGYLEFKDKKRPLSVFKTKKIHWEKAKGTKEDNIKYCSKEKNYCKELCIGFVPRREITFSWENNMKWWQMDIIKMIDEWADDRSIHWYWSSSGCIGKTQFSKYLTVKYGAIPLSGKGNDVRNGIIQYKIAEGHYPDLVVFPIPRSYDCEYLSYEALENIKDMYFYSGKYEGGTVCGLCPHLIVMANEEPNLSKCSPDRWNVVNIDETV